jgi:hypothetical protein
MTIAAALAILASLPIRDLKMLILYSFRLLDAYGAQTTFTFQINV